MFWLFGSGVQETLQLWSRTKRHVFFMARSLYSTLCNICPSVINVINVRADGTDIREQTDGQTDRQTDVLHLYDLSVSLALTDRRQNTGSTKQSIINVGCSFIISGPPRLRTVETTDMHTDALRRGWAGEWCR